MCHTEGRKPVISIIVPVYNVQPYIARCLDSLLGQTFTEYEILCVDDGSKDDSGKLCDAYAERDCRIKVFHIENHGVSHARNYALDRMQGEWFCFIDSDDWVEPDYLQTLYDLVMKHQCDIATCSFQRTGAKTEQEAPEPETLTVYTGPRECVRGFICGEKSMHGMLWNKIYRADCFADIRFQDLTVNEDCMYTFEVMSRCQKAVRSSKVLYYWFIRPDSACHSKKKEFDFSSSQVFLDLLEKTQDYHDTGITTKLKTNYVLNIIKVFMDVTATAYTEEAKAARNRCRMWKKEIWANLNAKNKLKYILVIRCNPVWQIYKKVKG